MLFRSLEKKKIKKFNLLGHSMGGKTAMMFSDLFPENINKLIIVDILPIYYKNNYNDIYDRINIESL